MLVPYFPYITTVQMITILTNIGAFSFTVIIKLWGLKTDYKIIKYHFEIKKHD